MIKDLPEPYLTLEQEFELARRIKKSKKEDDINKLVMSNIKEAATYLLFCARGSMDESMAISRAYAVLVKKARKYDASRGLRFFAYTKAPLRGDSTDYIRSNKGGLITTINAPGCFRRKYCKGIVSIHRPPSDNGYTTYLQHIVTPDSLFREDDYAVEDSLALDPDFESIFTRDRWDLVKPVIERCLTKHEQMILTLTYFQGFNNEEVGNLLDVSRSAVQSTNIRALKKVRRALCDKLRLLKD